VGGAAEETIAVPALGAEDLDEANLQKRLEAQKLVVARLVSEGKDATNANAKLYDLSKALSEIRSKTSASSTAQ
jgi:hypothetical protein